MLQQLDAFLAAKITVASESVNTDLVWVGHAVIVLVAVVFEDNSLFNRVRAEQIGVAILVAGCDQLFQLQLFEVVREVAKTLLTFGSSQLHRTLLFLKCFV